MTALILAALLAIDLGPKESPADDFAEQVTAVEQNTGCPAAYVYRCDVDDYRIVVFRCSDADAALVFVKREAGDWVVLRRVFKREAARDGVRI